ncbi:hypothetical protein [Burkholderia sp. Ac-20345]|uniref:hypothetical protein n=1 Tax=Burkholderia sp. Ac-20345 TaxID=2703891 RepID=UPI0032173255
MRSTRVHLLSIARSAYAAAVPAMTAASVLDNATRRDTPVAARHSSDEKYA